MGTTDPRELGPSDGKLLRPQCYCTIMERRARFMRNGFQEVPCDGTLCAWRRVQAEAAATSTPPPNPVPKATEHSLDYLLREERWPHSTTALIG